jgi:hypothetical protein
MRNPTPGPNGGEELERAIWHETPAPVEHRLVLDLLRDRGARLNHPAVSVLSVIAVEPGHTNHEIALRVGIEGKGDASPLLARLARFGLIENIRTGAVRTSGRPLPSPTPARGPKPCDRAGLSGLSGRAANKTRCRTHLVAGNTPGTERYEGESSE